MKLKKSLCSAKTFYSFSSALLVSSMLVACSDGTSSNDADSALNVIDTDITTRARSVNLVRLTGDSTDSNGNSADANCGGTYPDATATLDLLEQPGKTGVTVTIANAIPNTLFTAWLRIKGTTDKGVSFGGNPLNGAGSTPLAASTALAELIEATGEGNGTTETPNGILTDDSGNAVLMIDVDFPIDDGAYPFQKLGDFDPTDPRFKAEAPAAYPVAIVNSATGDVDASYMIRIASHCTDNLSHGLDSGPHEPWFDLKGL